MIRKINIIFLISLFSSLLIAQNVNVENVLGAGKNKPLAFNGGLSAGSIHYTANESFSGR